MVFHKPRLINIISYVLFGVSALILAGVISLTMNVDVLRDWKITLPPGDIHVGDTVVLQSTYTKLRSITGTATRYLDCINGGGTNVRYPINEARADRAPGSRTGTGVILKIPTVVPNLPAKCRISIVVAYKVYPWRTVTEFQSSREFTLLPSVTPVGESSSATQTSQSLSVVPGPVAGSSSNNALVSEDVQSSILQNPGNQQAVSVDPEPRPNFIQRLLMSVTNVL
jgi:hypothetical protein